MKTIEFNINDLQGLKLRLYQFANQFDVCHIYDSNSNDAACKASVYEFLLALGSKRDYTGKLEAQLSACESSTYWKFMSIPYGQIDEIDTANVFEPLIVFSIARNAQILKIINNGISETQFSELYTAFENFKIDFNAISINPLADFEPNTVKSEYIKQIEQIRQDIYNGVYYEINYCIEFKAKFESQNLLPLYLDLNTQTKAPFAAYVKHPNMSMLCSSPERFVKREGKVLLSQPIKGTNKRLEGAENIEQLESLTNSTKERAENVMIVDLVRNDMAKVSIPGTVEVLELCGAYAYKSVNHLVSTVQSVLNSQVSILQIFNSMFPMGSMTGAPKIEVMKHILKYENTERGYYSGCIGYIDSDGDFDFNVCIRTLIYSPTSQEISYKVGSAITYDSCPEQEYDECLIKGSRMLSVFKKV